MARIRSIHPAQWTDEEFVRLSPLARLLTIAVRNDADDQGVFEWKPLTLKMRLFPNDTVEIEPLLVEMERANQVKRYTVNGHQYGVIRNFRKFQSPKKPRFIYPLPLELRSYVDPPSSPPVGKEFPTSTEPVGDSFPPEKEKEKYRDREQDMDREFSLHNTADKSALPDEIAEVVRLWNEKAEACDYSRVVVTGERRQKLIARALELCGGIDGWKQALALIDKSSFLKGETNAAYIVTFDSIIKTKNFIKLIEGGFNDRKNNRSRNGGNGWHKRTSDYIGEYEQANGIVRDYVNGGWSIEEGEPEPIDITPGGEADNGDREGPRVLPHKP